MGTASVCGILIQVYNMHSFLEVACFPIFELLFVMSYEVGTPKPVQQLLSFSHTHINLLQSESILVPFLQYINFL